jgi:uncharacterized DUF497 family protein
MLFEWDETKRQDKSREALSTSLVLCGYLTARYSRSGSDVYMKIGCSPSGLLEDIEIVVVYVLHGKYRRIISARRANRNERQDYASHLEAADRGHDEL